METLHFYLVFSAVLGLVLAVPSNTCIVIVNLKTIRKKGKLSPSDVIFLAKAIVNVLLQGLLSLQGMLVVFSPGVHFFLEMYTLMDIPVFFLTYSSFWLTAWLSVHYCTSITNLRSGFFIWIKRVVSHSLGQILVLTVVGLVPATVPAIWTLDVVYDSTMKPPKNSSSVRNIRQVYYFMSVTILGCILPFCLSLLSLHLTVSFLVRHVWRVKNNDSGSTRPNLQAHVTALRTIVFFLLMSIFFFTSQVLYIIRCYTHFRYLIGAVSMTFQNLSPSAEAAIIFQASNKLRKILLRRFWTRRLRNS